MSVEDIDFLLENSEKDNFILHIDSAVRNRDFYPKPNEYVIKFDEPFKFVYGIEILDASIPSTMYNIDTHNNILSSIIYKENPHVNMSFQTLLNELSLVNGFDDVMKSNDVIIESSGVESVFTYEMIVTTAELLISNNFNLTRQSGGRYIVMLRYERLNIPIIEEDEVPLITFVHPIFSFRYEDKNYFIENDPLNTVIQEVIAMIQNVDNTSGFAAKLSLPGATDTSQFGMKKNNKFDWNFYYYDCISVRYADIENLMSIPENATAESIKYWTYIGFQTIKFNTGNYGVTAFIDETKRALGGSRIIVNASSLGDVSIQAKLSYSSSYGFIFDMERSTIRTSLGFDEYAEATQTKIYQKYYYKDNKRLFGGIFNPRATSYSLTAPGVIYLLGTRYCILRCQELDDHLYGSRAYGRFSPGIGLFKLYAVNDIAHQRFDFVNFQKKPFHPIGKLDKMSLRFETTEGTLYDFKGANHLLLISIKYLVPTQKRRFERSILNPNYDYNYHSYMSRKIEYKEVESEDDADDSLLNLEKNHLLKQEEEYDESTTSDEDTATDSDASSEIDFFNKTS